MQDPKNRHLGTIVQLCRFATETCIDSWKKTCWAAIFPPHVGPLAADIVSLVWGTPANFNGFRLLAALLRGTSTSTAKLCGVEQRAPPIFGRAAITLGIGPHSSIILLCSVHVKWLLNNYFVLHSFLVSRSVVNPDTNSQMVLHCLAKSNWDIVEQPPWETWGQTCKAIASAQHAQHNNECRCTTATAFV